MSATSPQFATRYPRYKIGSGDSFDVSFELSPETVTVQPDGFVTLRGIGDVVDGSGVDANLEDGLERSWKGGEKAQIVVM